MEVSGRYAQAIEHLKENGLRPTRQRKILAKLLFDHDDRHVTPDKLYQEVKSLKTGISRATVYNTLHQFTKIGLLHEVVVESGQSHFDTNLSPHHHFYFEEDGRLEDIPGEGVVIKNLSGAPIGHKVRSIDVVIRLSAD